MTKYNKFVIKILKKSEEEMYNLSHSIVGIEHLILATLNTKNDIKALLNNYGVTYEKYKEKLVIIKKPKQKSNYVFYSSALKKVIDASSDNAVQFSSEEITLEHIFLSIIEENNNLGMNILSEFGINNENFYKDIIKLIKINKNLLIYEIGTNLNELAKENKLEKVVGREKEIEEIIEILARKNKNNPILIGEAGVGKTALVEGLANRITKNKVPDFLKNIKIVSLNIASVISGTKYRGEFEEKLTKILKECEEIDDIIIFIDEVHTIVGAGGAEGAIDASNILKPILARGNLKIIGATTINEYKKFIAIDKALDRRFQKIYIEEPDEEATYNILKKIKKDYEKFHKVSVSENILKNIIYLSKKYIFDRNEPDKSIDILDEVCASTRISSNNKFKEEKIIKKIKEEKELAIKNQDFLKAKKLKEKEQELYNNVLKEEPKIKEVKLATLKKVIEKKCNGKIYDLNDCCIKYKEIEIKLNSEIIGQKKAIKELVNVLKISNNKKDTIPTSILFSGNSGIGKTETVKVLAQTENLNLIKLNMNEYTSELSINKILGSPQGYVGYNDNNTSLEEIKLKPNSIILLEDIDKAHPLVFNLFLSILENGNFKNSKNELINLNNSMIIMTTKNFKENTRVGYVSNSDKKHNLSDTFSNDFLNHIERIINFKDLTKKNIKDIINLNLEKINSYYDKNILLSDSVIESIIKESSYKENGAHNVKTKLKKYVEKYLVISNTL